MRATSAVCVKVGTFRELINFKIIYEGSGDTGDTLDQLTRKMKVPLLLLLLRDTDYVEMTLISQWHTFKLAKLDWNSVLFVDKLVDRVAYGTGSAITHLGPLLVLLVYPEPCSWRLLPAWIVILSAMPGRDIQQLLWRR